MHTKFHTRRSFLKNAGLGGISISVLPQLQLIGEIESGIAGKKDPHIFLFQGDSITDGNRGRNNDPNHIMGHGYAFSIASRVGARFPEKGLTFYNRGISGNTIQDLSLRWEKDSISLKPDVLSILIGVNDTDFAIRKNDADATNKFEEDYTALISQTKKQLPDCLLVLCEPFIAPVGRVKEQWNKWHEEIAKKQEAIRRLSKEYNTVYVPLQNVFDDAGSRASPGYWIWDGIHPTVAGHELIAHQWLKQVSKELHFLKKLL